MPHPFSPSAITSPEGLCIIRMVLLVLKEFFYWIEQSNPHVDKKVPLVGFWLIFIFVDEILACAGRSLLLVFQKSVNPENYCWPNIRSSKEEPKRFSEDYSSSFSSFSFFSFGGAMTSPSFKSLETDRNGPVIICSSPSRPFNI
ncbi:MAG: hypothetical protein ACJA2S_001501 [Cyclobacteriaceae bacterium]|jgi:hypothetical protein